MDAYEYEGIARAAYRAAGFDESSAAPAVALASHLLGPDAVVRLRGASLVGDAALARVGERWQIFVKARLPQQRTRFAICHELAEYLLIREGFQRTDVERQADGLAAALLAPREAFKKALRTAPEFAELADVFKTTQSLVALRLGEVTGEPLALVSPNRVRVRGDAWVWPQSEEAIRALAKGSRPGLRKARITDASKRVVLRAVPA